jgi:hypothetical protein
MSTSSSPEVRMKGNVITSGALLDIYILRKQADHTISDDKDFSCQTDVLPNLSSHQASLDSL